MTKAMPSVAVVGGGVIGASIAFHLSKEGAAVTLIEQGDLASGSSGACDGLVFMQSKKPGVHLSLGLKSLALYKTLKEQLPIDIEFRQTGGLVIIETKAQYQAMEKYVKAQKQIGLDVCLLDREQTLEKEPFLSPGITGAAFSPLDAQVNPIRLTLSLVLGAKQLGATILTQTRVTGFCRKHSTVTGVETNKGPVYADVTVNACGALAGRTGELAGVSMPVTPRRGQIVVTRADRRVLNHCLLSASYIAAKFDPALAASAGQGISMEQTENGNLLLGSTREFAGFDKTTTMDGMKKILRQTAALVPVLGQFQVIRTFAGLRPYTPDGLPILGPVRGLNNFYMAAGHEGDGIALAPVTGHLMARMILGRDLDVDLSAFSPGRFMEPFMEPSMEPGENQA